MKESIKKLPITVPEIKTYPAETYLMSVLPQNSASKNWIFSNYINTGFTKHIHLMIFD